MLCSLRGDTGNGKSYTAVKWILEHIARGGCVATNIPLKIDPWDDEEYGPQPGIRVVLEENYNWDLQEGQIIQLSDTDELIYTDKNGKKKTLNSINMYWKLVPKGTKKKPVLIVIDEAHVHFPQDGYRFLPSEIVNHFTLCRHAGNDIVFITQEIENCWNKVRQRCEFHYHVRDLKKHGLPLHPAIGFLIGFLGFECKGLPYPFNQHLLVKKDKANKNVMSKSVKSIRKFVYGCYSSPEIVDSFNQPEGKTDFGESGKRAAKASNLQKLSLSVAGLFLGVLFTLLIYPRMSKGEQVDQKETAKRFETRQSARIPDPKPNYITERITEPYSWTQQGENIRVWFRGDNIKRGREYVYGICTLCTSRVLEFRDGENVLKVFNQRGYAVSTEPTEEDKETLLDKVIGG